MFITRSSRSQAPRRRRRPKNTTFGSSVMTTTTPSSVAAVTSALCRFEDLKQEPASAEVCHSCTALLAYLRQHAHPLSLYHICDSTTIRLRSDDTTTHSTTTEVIEITICVRFDCNTTTTRLRRKIDMFIFCSRRIASNGSRRDTSWSDRSRIVYQRKKYYRLPSAF